MADLELIPLKEAQQKFQENIKIIRKTERIPVKDALNRVTVKEVRAKLSMPNYRASAMDGIAVRAEKVKSASVTKPVELQSEEYQHINTSSKIPEQFDAVVMLEDIEFIGDKVLVKKEVTVGKNIREIGEDIKEGDLIVPAHHRLRPVDLGLLLAGGILELEVFAKPKIAIIPTGSELVEPTENLNPGEIIEFNGTMMVNMLKEWGAEPIYLGIVKDDYQAILSKVREIIERVDMVLINAGSSKGKEDYTVQVIKALGDVYVHGLYTRPAKPVILGEIYNKPVIGVPGYPVSAFLTLEWFVLPYISYYYRVSKHERVKVKVKLLQDVTSNIEYDDFIRLVIKRRKDELTAEPLSRSAGMTSTLVKADALLIVPIGHPGYKEGDIVEVELFNTVISQPLDKELRLR